MLSPFSFLLSALCKEVHSWVGPPLQRVGALLLIVLVCSAPAEAQVAREILVDPTPAVPVPYTYCCPQNTPGDCVRTTVAACAALGIALPHPPSAAELKATYREQLRPLLQVHQRRAKNQPLPYLGEPLGDQLLWFLQHDKVEHVVVGTVTESQSFWFRHPTDIWTLCRVTIRQVYKGPGLLTIDFVAPGGTVGGTAASSSKHAQCSLGASGLFFIARSLSMETPGDYVATGSQTFAAREPAESEGEVERAWYAAVVEAVETLAGTVTP